MSQIWGDIHWLWLQLTLQVDWSQNMLFWVTLMTGLILAVEHWKPWRKEQAFFRKDWGQDLAYLYLNIFVFSIALRSAYTLLSTVWSTDLNLLDLRGLAIGWQLLIFFVLQDFLQWCVHRLLHGNAWLWRFHQIHHSVEEMGVAAHFRYHWLENVFYRPTTLATLAFFGGVEPSMAMVVHLITLGIGHLNHSNLYLSWGPLRYIFNSPSLHLLHHSREHIKGGGVNFGLSLSCWDYLFGTAVEPTLDGTLPLGFEGVEQVPKSLWSQLMYGFQGKQDHR